MSNAGNRILNSIRQARRWARGETTEGFVVHAPDKDAEDLAALEKHRAHEASVGGYQNTKHECLTGDEADRLLAGESPVRVWREKRGLAQCDLANKAGISSSYLSRIESRARRGSAATFRKLAAVLDVPMEALMPATA